MRALGLLTVLLIAGCAPTPPVEPAGPTDPTPTATFAVPAPPQQVLDGNCDFLDGWRVVEPDPRLSPINALIQQNGGVRCAWQLDDRSIFAVLLPETAVVIPVATDCGEAFDAAATSCAVDAVVNGIRISGHALGNDVALAQADRDAIIAAFTATATDAAAVLAPAPEPDAWPAIPDCSSLAGSAALADATGLDVEFTGESFAFGLASDTYVAPAERALQAERGSCGVFGIDGDEKFGLEFTTLGGGRWMETAMREAKGARVVEVDGLELVITVPSPTYGETVNVFDGVNWLQTDQQDDDRLYPALAAIVAELNR